MTRFTVSGTSQEILSKLEALKEVADRRRDEGWQLFQSDESWTYETRNDVRVCSVCRMYESMREYNGLMVPTQFSYWSRLEQNSVYPDVHSMPEYAFLHGECRCKLTWYNYFIVLTERFWREMEAVAT